MKVTLIDYTGKGHSDPNHAVNILIFTKNTRLQMSPLLLEEIANWSWADKMKELEYMANTIPSSWEFVDYTFMIEEVTRAFTHQLVRTRTASFAQQTMRVLDVSQGAGWDYLTGPSIENDDINNRMYGEAMDAIASTYKSMIANGAAVEDARGILPTNILTNIVMKCDMRTFVDLVRKRSGPRTQGEYRDVLEAMKDEVRSVHPWIDIFISRNFELAAANLDEIIKSIPELVEGFDPQVLKNQMTTMLKLVDQMRRFS